MIVPVFIHQMISLQQEKTASGKSDERKKEAEKEK